MMIGEHLKAAEMEYLKVLSQNWSGKCDENQKNVNQDSW
jgi:hypothetical protein